MQVDSGHCGGGARVGEGHLLNRKVTLLIKHIIVHNADIVACLSGPGLEDQCYNREPVNILGKHINVIVKNVCRERMVTILQAIPIQYIHIII